MGCATSKDTGLYNQLDPNNQAKFNIIPTEGVYYFNEKDAYTKSLIYQAIKKGDIILFKQITLQHQVNPTELVGNSVERKAVLHVIAENNFVNGMNFVLNYIMKADPLEIKYILNSRDAAGNTSVILCCMNDAVQTLEALLKTEQVDVEITNNMGKTALQIALEKESLCAKYLSIYLTRDPKPNNEKNFASVNLSGLSTQGAIYQKKEKEDELISANVFTDMGKLLNSADIFINLTDRVQIPPNTRLSQVVECLKDTGTNFVDEEFMHDNYSIGGDTDLMNYFKDSDTFVWLRPEEFLNSNNIRIFDKIELNDVSKSPLAGCDFYSALAAMTEFPHRLTKIFTTKEPNSYGAYSVTLYVCGVLIEILLDDYFPCVEEGPQLIFSKPRHNELWFSLIEKAFAKLYGNYAELTNLTLVGAFELMTGMPSVQYELKQSLSEDNVWNLLVDFNKRNYIVCVGKEGDHLLNKGGYLNVVAVIEYNGNRVIKLRFQDGNGAPYQQFIEKAKKWGSALKEKVGYFEKEKECCCMGIKELIEHFDVLSVCYYQDGWNRNRIDANTGHNEAMFFELNVNRETEMFISIYQKLECFVEDAPDYAISPVEITLAKQSDQKFQLLQSGNKEATTSSTIYLSEQIRMQLDEGKYILRVKVQWVDKRNHDFSLSTVSQLPINCKIVDKTDYPDFLEKVYTQVALTSQDKFLFNHDCSFVSAWAGSHLWLCAINNGSKTWNLEVVFDIMENLKIAKKFRQKENIISFKVSPQQRATAFVKRLSPDEISFKWHFNQDWE